MDSKYNGFDFIDNYFNNDNLPLLRFKGNSIEEYNAWYESTSHKLRDLMGIDKIKAVPLEPILLEEKSFEKYKRYKYQINTAEKLSMPFYVLEPENKIGKAVIALHGHGSDGKEGLVANEKESYKASVERFNYTYGFELMKKGYTVFIPDLLGAGERTLGLFKNNNAECNDINNALISFGLCLQGVILFENIRLVDYITEIGFSEVDCCGFSGGGHSALWLGVMEERVKRIYISGFLHSFRESLIYKNRCGCNFIPNQWNYVDMGDILALGAGKKFYIETGDMDDLNGERGIESVKEQIEIADKCFRLFNNKVNFKACEGKHQWYGAFDF